MSIQFNYLSGEVTQICRKTRPMWPLCKTCTQVAWMGPEKLLQYSDSICKCTSLLDGRRGVGEVGWCGITGRHHIGEEEWARRKEESNAREHKSKLLLLHSVGQSGCFWQPQQEEGRECVRVHASVCVHVCMFMQEWVTAYPSLSLFVFMCLALWGREMEKAALFCI